MTLPNKTIVILDHGDGRLGNQLWNFANVLAYCFERGYGCRNYAFYRYDRFFKGTLTHPLFGHILKYVPGRLKRPLHKTLQSYIFRRKGILIIDSEAEMDTRNNKPFYLVPSMNKNALSRTQTRLENFEVDTQTTAYFTGWMFRNPEGVIKYHDLICAHLQPNKAIMNRAKQLIHSLRQSADEIIGIHIRKTDYSKYANGAFYFDEHMVRPIIDSYLAYRATTDVEQKKISFLICSDDPHLDVSTFTGLDFTLGPSDPVTTMFALSLTDLIIGSDSTFGGFAAYYGNIPIIFFSRNPIDWNKQNTDKSFSYWNGSRNMQL